MKSKLLKGSLTVVGAILVTTLGIYASDRLQGIDGNLASISGSSSACPRGSVPLRGSHGTICVDAYEVSPSESCPHDVPASALESEENVSNSECYGSSREEAQPWRFISLPQAQRVCARNGKRLPTSDEWYRAALGTDPDTCTINASGPTRTGAGNCTSAIGVNDLIGNLWEWVDETVVNATVDDRPLPQEGFVTSVDASGIAISTEENAEELYGSDYFWSKQDGVFGMIRGGYYGSRSDAGLYAVNASVQTSFASQGVGFRCVEDV